MTTLDSYFARFHGPVTLRECPRCCTAYRLVSFRREDPTHPDKRTLQHICNACDEDERRMREREVVPSTAQLVRRSYQRRRKLNWSVLLFRRLQRERTWAQHHAQLAVHPLWERFFQAYAQTLRSVHAKATLASRKPNAPINPTPKEVNPHTYTDAHTIRTLKELYSSCPVIKGRKMYRDPWFLDWSDEDA